MITETLARFFGLHVSETPRAAEPRSPRPPRRVCATPDAAVEPELPSLEAELARLDHLDLAARAA